MSDTEAARHVTSDPGRLGGKPCIRSLRISVAQILADLAYGASWHDILNACPDLSEGDISAALLYAANRLDEGRP